jgi:regulator of vacuolar morphogenesis
MTSIQALFIRGHEERTEPSPHIVYRIEIQASVRSWNVWRRYSEFADLHVELTKSTGQAPPAPLPPKHSTLSLFRTRNNPTLMTERTQGLEAYLRAIIASPDERWRESHALKEFLGVPPGTGASAAAPERGGFTSASWLDEHLALQARVRDVRADVGKRDALSAQGDVAGAHTANVGAKKVLAGLLSRVNVLEDGVKDLAASGMAEGELRRRSDMAARIRDDCESLAKIVTAARHTSTASKGSAGVGLPPASDRQSLFSTGSSSRPSVQARSFGPPKPVETEETRALGEEGLLQLQQKKIEDQDTQLDALTTIIRRQKQIGLAIHQEVSEQIEILTDLDRDVDRTTDKLGKAKKQLNRLG